MVHSCVRHGGNRHPCLVSGRMSSRTLVFEFEPMKVRIGRFLITAVVLCGRGHDGPRESRRAHDKLLRLLCAEDIARYVAVDMTGLQDGSAVAGAVGRELAFEGDAGVVGVGAAIALFGADQCLAGV